VRPRAWQQFLSLEEATTARWCAAMDETARVFFALGVAFGRS
jgi:hypothetical protein